MKTTIFLSLAAAFLLSLTFVQQEEKTLLTEGYKYEVAKQVYDQLISAKGDKRLNVPEFVMSKRTRYVAWMNGKNAQVGLEEKAYDICASYGADSLNAIAALLGHEIIHYYEKHNWGSDFASAYMDVEIAADIKTNTKTMEVKAVNETEADYLGGFLAHSAGFNTFGIMPEFLHDVYEAYGLKSEIPGYPSLDDRAKLAVEAEQRMANLVSIYQLANHMVVLKQFADADAYFAYVLKEFQSREVYNNAGVNAIMSALAIIPEDHKARKYEYPLQIDGETRMIAKPKGSDIEAFGDAEQKAFVAQLKKAVSYFEQAKTLDENYGTAYLNLACAYDLLEEHEDATYWAKKAYKLGKSNKNIKVEGDAKLVMAIANLNDGEVEDGKEQLAEVQQKYTASADLATLNLQIATNNSRPLTAAPKEKIALKAEKIEDFDLAAFLENLEVDKQIEISSTYTFAVKKLENSKVLVNIYNGGDRAIAVQLTEENFTGTTAFGFSVGTDKATFLAKYGEPSYTKETRKGQYWVYEKRKAVFYIKNGQLDSWSIYRLFPE